MMEREAKKGYLELDEIDRDIDLKSNSKER